tara:strand:+ start:631 stop:1230 length:600 start_codon:yes stop_codon:yes gene_type:complete
MDALQTRLLNAALPGIAFDGWDMQVIRAAAVSLDLPKEEADRAFPGGAFQALNVWVDGTNAQLRETLANDYNFESMKIRERIATGVMVRLRAQQLHREAVRKGLALYQLPWNAPDGLKHLYATVDIIWRAAGDTSTDWNFYSKRTLLAKVYSSTLLYWLNDDSPNQSDTEAFLHRRIEDVMQIQKFKGKLTQWRQKAAI